MSTHNGEGTRVTVRDFQERKKRGEKIVVVTAYDALFGKLVDESGVDAVLVGDSLGNLLAGYETTLPVTLDQMVYHARSTRAGVKRALLIVDMPFLTYQVSPRRALENCGRVMQEGGADTVKLEGASENVLAAVRAVTGAGIPVMGHLGFTPQSVLALGGTRVQARDAESANKIVEDAKRLEEAGAFSIVLELVPANVAARVTEAVSVPTIGIGAGASCSGQVLVLHDLLGLNEGFSPKFLKRYAAMAAEVRDAISRFGDEVRAGSYPDDDHSF
ncbi:MAG: 3-methyl-2-oxobutanoate hydroxymethyltransferase [Gemmatimonadetes bacterium]|jgi:3-methyl-2-oxobutanoate hydroxymethyltransferase|nr:3-methyl-2-oxobutanoate hydroxymethyltransferase [Gemmatimonadota bacterium]